MNDDFFPFGKLTQCLLPVLPKKNRLVVKSLADIIDVGPEVLAHYGTFEAPSFTVFELTADGRLGAAMAFF